MSTPHTHREKRKTDASISAEGWRLLRRRLNNPDALESDAAPRGGGGGLAGMRMSAHRFHASGDDDTSESTAPIRERSAASSSGSRERRRYYKDAESLASREAKAAALSAGNRLRSIQKIRRRARREGERKDPDTGGGEAKRSPRPAEPEAAADDPAERAPAAPEQEPEPEGKEEAHLEADEEAEAAFNQFVGSGGGGGGGGGEALEEFLREEGESVDRANAAAAGAEEDVDAASNYIPAPLPQYAPPSLERLSPEARAKEIEEDASPLRKCFGCWASQKHVAESSIVPKHPLAKLNRFISENQMQGSMEDLCRQIQEKYETMVRPYIEPQTEARHWTLKSIHEHLTEHTPSVEWTLVDIHRSLTIHHNNLMNSYIYKRNPKNGKKRTDLEGIKVDLSIMKYKMMVTRELMLLGSGSAVP